MHPFFPFLSTFYRAQVIDKSMPVFSKQFYSDTVAENIELHSPLSVAIQAESPLGRKLIYSIVKGNEMEEFAVDFNTGTNLASYIILIPLLPIGKGLHYHRFPDRDATRNGGKARFLVGSSICHLCVLPPFASPVRNGAAFFNFSDR